MLYGKTALITGGSSPQRKMWHTSAVAVRAEADPRGHVASRFDANRRVPQGARSSPPSALHNTIRVYAVKSRL